MARFHTLTVSDVRRETPDCVSIALEVPGALKEAYRFIQGQYLTFRLRLNGGEIRRSYSICTSPVADGELRIAAKKVPGGRGSVFLNEQVNKGDRLEVMTPMGSFHTKLEPSNRKNYCLFAGGSGITPVMSILKTVLHVERESRPVLFYANRDEQSVIFRAELDELALTHKGRLTIHHILAEPPAGTDELYAGIMTKEKVAALADQFIDAGGDNEFFICGPSPMMSNVKDVLEERKTDPARIHIEYFTAVPEDIGRAEAVAANGASADAAVEIVSSVTVVMDDVEFPFELSSKGKVILEAAEEAGVDAPFSCKGAVCCTCKAKVLEGRVTMDKNFALSDAEVAEGYVLTCQSHPASEKVVVSYDEV